MDMKCLFCLIVIEIKWVLSVLLATQSCPTLWDPMDYSPPGSSVHGILQARILEWVAIPFSRGSSRLGLNWGLLHCRQILYHLSHRGSPSNFLLAIYFTRTGTSFSFADILHHFFFSLSFIFFSTCSIEYNPHMVFLCLKVFYWLPIIILCKKWVCKLKFELHFSLYVI